MNSLFPFFVVMLLVFGGQLGANATLDPEFYALTCPDLHSIVHKVLFDVSRTDTRMPASLIRLHFHDCFVQGCDASILLNKTSTMDSEQDAAPNLNSIRGLDVINKIKSAVENSCPKTVSCADILTLAAGVSTYLTGGPSWAVPLGRRDGLNANQTAALTNLPGPNFDLPNLKKAFNDQGLSTIDLVALSGAHTFGKSRCLFFVDRLYNFNDTGKADPTMNATYLEELRKECPKGGDVETRVNFDPTTKDSFDKNYYNNLKANKGLLTTDQELFSTEGADTVSYVNAFAAEQNVFFENFVKSMIKMSSIDVLTGNEGEIRQHCNFVNQKSSGRLEVNTESAADKDMFG